MSAPFTIEIEDRTLNRRMRELTRRLGDITPVLNEIGDSVASDVRLSFVSGRSPYGEPWPPLRFRSGQPLRDTGRLMNSITYRVGKNHVEIGTNVCYAPVHQYGATIKASPGQPGRNRCGVRRGAPFLVFRGMGGETILAKEVRIPPRPFLPDERGLPPTMRRNVLNVINRYLTGGSA